MTFFSLNFGLFSLPVLLLFNGQPLKHCNSHLGRDMGPLRVSECLAPDVGRGSFGSCRLYGGGLCRWGLFWHIWWMLNQIEIWGASRPSQRIWIFVIFCQLFLRSSYGVGGHIVLLKEGHTVAMGGGSWSKTMFRWVMHVKVTLTRMQGPRLPRRTLHSNKMINDSLLLTVLVF